MDNTNSHRNAEVKALINKKNKLLHSVRYQHFTNGIENFFSILKSRLQKLEGLTLEDLRNNVSKVLAEIPLSIYENIFIGNYQKPDNYEPKRRKHIDKNYK